VLQTNDLCGSRTRNLRRDKPMR